MYSGISTHNILILFDIKTGVLKSSKLGYDWEKFYSMAKWAIESQVFIKYHLKKKNSFGEMISGHVTDTDGF